MNQKLCGESKIYWSSEENAQVIANTLENTAELNNAANEVKNAQTKGSFKEKLKKKNCNI